MIACAVWTTTPTNGPGDLYARYQKAQREANTIKLRLQREGARLSKAEQLLLKTLLNQLQSEAEDLRAAWFRSVHGKTGDSAK